MVTLEIDEISTELPDEDAVALLEQLDRPRRGQAEHEARELADGVRAAQLSGVKLTIDSRLALALLAAIDDLERARPPHELSGTFTLLRGQLHPLVGIGLPHSEA
jgi:hypothetical protein